MTADRQQRIRQVLRDIGADWALLSGPDAVCYATGQPIQIETGPSPFTGGPALAFVGRQGGVGLVCSNVEGNGQGIEAEVYAGFAARVTDQVAGYRAAVERLVRRLGVGGRLAIQAAHHPASLADLLPGPHVLIDRALDRARAVKTASEIAALRHVGAITAQGQIAARAVSRAGLSEVEVLNGIRAVIEQAAGLRCPLTGEYVGGIERTATLGSPPGARRLMPGDPVIVDLAPRVAGYWGDSCASFVIGTPTHAWMQMFSRARETLALAMATLRPGLGVGSFDAALRAHMAGAGYGYPHHSGHGIGTSVHEWPRLVPDETAVIEEDMVIMVEPGSYVPGVGGVRCEYMLRVTATGCESLTDFPLGPL